MTDTNQHPNIARAEILRALSRNHTFTMPDANDTLNIVAASLESDAKRYEESAKLQQIGKNCAECLAEMVAALECDYARLTELREARHAFEYDPPENAAVEWACENPENADELAELEEAAGDCESEEAARQRIEEDPLSIELGGKWSLGETPSADRAYILLGTGGPATRIVCELDEHMEPTRAWVQAQDWFLPWTDYTGGTVSGDTLLAYCRCFYFGEG